MGRLTGLQHNSVKEASTIVSDRVPQFEHTVPVVFTSVKEESILLCPSELTCINITAIQYQPMIKKNNLSLVCSEVKLYYYALH